MRKLRVIILIFAAAVIAIFTVVRVREYSTSDSVAPIITAADRALLVSVSVTDEDLMTGMRAMDNLDGDVTDTLVVVSRSKFISKGTVRVNYAAFDENNNVGVFSREVTYADYYSPRFTVTQPLRFVSGNSNYDYLRSIFVYDCLDGNISQQIKITLGNTQALGDNLSSCPLYLMVTNSAGDSSTLQLEIQYESHSSYSQSAPALTDYVIYTKAGTRPDLRANLNGIWAGGNVRPFQETTFDPQAEVAIHENGADFNTPGIYNVTYQLSREAKDGSRTDLGRAVLTVVVEE